MPIYEYQPATEAHCDHCRNGFDVLQKLADDELECCPQCDAPIARRITAPNVQAGQSHLLKEKHFSEKGFTQYRKVEKGVYEKTAGKGPDMIKDQ